MVICSSVSLPYSYQSVALNYLPLVPIEDGSVRIPEVLRPYMGGKDFLRA